MPAVEATMPFEPMPASVQTEMQRVLAARGEVAIDSDQVLHSADLARDHDTVATEAEFHRALRGVERRHDQRLAHDFVRVERLLALRVLVHHAGQQILIEAAPVHADAHRLGVAARDFDHLGELRIALAAATDVAGVDAVLSPAPRRRPDALRAGDDR
jgi:hypothetical protein